MEKEKTEKKKTVKKASAKTTNKYKYIVIVESPAKSKTIKKYLGKDYEVVASMGHIRDLPKSRLGVDVDDNFEPSYINIKGKAPIINDLKNRAKGCEKVFLAADPDREGEAISYHISNILGLDINDDNRVTFNEITKDAVLNAIKNPRKVNLSLFDAQQARRVLDRLVGYKLSPFLWQKVKRGLSAGRVQSVAVKMIVDRENEIRSFITQEYWSVEATVFEDIEKNKFISKVSTFKGKKIDIENAQQADDIETYLNDQQFIIDSIKKSVRKKQPSPPFITSTLQQDASRKLNFQTSKTMRIAQELYEGVDIKGMGGTQGLITYMRTDSFRLSPDAIIEGRNFIEKNYGKNYLPESPRYYKSKKKTDVQDAHEAIRPTVIELSPIKIKDNLSNDQYKLYKLIWDRFIACQMADCLLDTVSVSIKAGDYGLKTSGFTVKFKGFTFVYSDDDGKKDEKQMVLPELTENANLNLNEIAKNQHFTQPPPRYSEASLVKTLEENGIGRPSTYSPTITTILGRGYIERDKKNLLPTELGEVTTALMKEHFTEIVDEEFSANMENALDKVEDGIEPWKNVIAQFYEGFSLTLDKAQKELEGTRIELTQIVTDEICDLCGRNMVVKQGRFGDFLACPDYPECKNTKPITKKSDGDCPLCNNKILIKKSKKGKVY
ncbi:MAG: type I DNA topoisomerase, partial [Oscillospiraceae bacterium]